MYEEVKHVNAKCRGSVLETEQLCVAERERGVKEVSRGVRFL